MIGSSWTCRLLRPGGQVEISPPGGASTFRGRAVMARRTTPKREREQRTAFATPTKASTKCCWYLWLTSADTNKYTNSLLRHYDTKRNALGTSESETAPKHSRISAYNHVKLLIYKYILAERGIHTGSRRACF